LTGASFVFFSHLVNIKAIHKQTFIFTTSGVIPARDACIFVAVHQSSQIINNLTIKYNFIRDMR
jgi:hypothetical protein